MKTPDQNTTKPTKQILEYFDYDDIENYFQTKYKFDMDIFWDYLCDEKKISNGDYVVISNWEMVYNNGEFVHLIPEKVRPFIKAITDEFGETNVRLTPGNKSCVIRVWW